MAGLYALICILVSVIQAVSGQNNLLPRDDIIHICNANNCLRQIRSNSIKASPFCTSYLGNPNPRIQPPTSTFTAFVRETVFAVGTAGDLVTRRDTPYIPPNKRELKINHAALPTPTLELRQAAPPTFASSCNTAPTQLSSACTCLIGSTEQTPISTSTQIIHGAYVTQSVCGPNPSAELRKRDYGGFVKDAATHLSDEAHPEITDLQHCCATCFHTPGCVAYYIDLNSGACHFTKLTASSAETPKDKVCPAGIIELYDPFQNDYPADYGLGVCAYLEFSDE